MFARALGPVGGLPATTETPLSRKWRSRSAEPTRKTPPSLLSFSFSKVPLHSAGPVYSDAAAHSVPEAPPPLQAKLQIGSVDDPLEKEADVAAERVMRMPDPAPAMAPRASNGPGEVVQRKCDACTAAEKLRRTPDGSGIGGAAAPAIVHHALRSPGAPLDASARAFMEPRFGRDFGRVRIHTGSLATQAAGAIGARAFTVGEHIVAPDSEIGSNAEGGRRLLAHELAHVVQQGRTEPVVQRAMRKVCFAPSEVVIAATAGSFGAVAELVVDADYLRQKGGIPFGTVFFDNPLGPMSYVAFLAAHHPSLDVVLLAKQIFEKGGVLVPDILETRVPEFYDVKPNSPSGVSDGLGKLASIDAFMTFNALPYARGSAYTPTRSLTIPLASAALATALTTLLGPAVAIPLIACGLPDVTLEVIRSPSGLLLYRICIEADLDCYEKVIAIEALVAAIIIVVIELGPILFPPLPLPAPVPVPVPIGQGDGPSTPGTAVASAATPPGASPTGAPSVTS